MYQIVKTDGTAVGYTEKANYIKMGRSGSFTPTDREHAIGIAYDSIPYNLPGHSEIPDAPTVMVIEVDAGKIAAGTESVYAELAAAYQEGVNSIDE